MKILIAFLFILSISIQLFFIFSVSYGIDSDQAITGLMAKHILEGKIPVFFYGHAFNGSIEAFVASLFFFMFGVSCHALKLAPMTFGIIFCISTYYLGKELGGKKLGLWAFIFTLIAPIYLLAHYLAPRTCYIETLAFGNLMFIFLLKAVKQPAKQSSGILPSFRIRAQFRNVFLLGLFSGISFWNSPLAIYYFLSAGIFALIRGWRIINIRNMTIGVVSFIIGSLPLWIYNFAHHFESFKTAYSSGGIDIAENLKALFSYNGPILLVSGVFKSWAFWGIFVVFLLCFLSFIVSAIYKYKSNFLLLIIFFFTVLIIYSRSRYALLHTQRHLLPLYTFIPIAVAYSCRYLTKYKNIGTAIFIIILGINLSGSLFIQKEWLPGQRRDDKVFTELIEFLSKNNLTRVYAPFWAEYKINFISKEEIICSEYSDEIYKPYEEELDKADKVSFLTEGHQGIEDSLKRIRAKFSQTRISNKEVFYNIEKPSILGSALPPADWRITGNYNISKLRWAIDRDYNRFWSPGKTIKGVYPYIQIDLGQLFYLYKINIFNKGHITSYPEINIYVSADGAQWEPEKASGVMEPLFWSGPRPYYVKWYGRQEIWFGPKEARYIKIEFPVDYNFEIDEVFIYKYNGMEKRSLSQYKGCMMNIVEFLKEQKIDFVYADFWPAAKIRELSDYTVDSLEPINKSFPYRRHTSREVELDTRSAFLISNEDIDEFENILDKSELKFQMEDFDYYSLYYCPVGITEEEFVWDGLGLLKRKIEEYDMSRWRYPPKLPMHVEFQNGIKFLGYTLYTPRELIPGKCFKIDYFWQTEEGFPPELVIFVHIMKDGKIVFQNDHNFLEQFPVRKDQGVFKEAYVVKVPQEAVEGKYDIYLGLYLINQLKRINIMDPIEGEHDKIKIGELYVYSSI